MRLEYFQMVDRITTLDIAGGRIVTRCQVPDQSPVFEGHFPGYPIMPGVLLIETMAQTGGWLILASQRCARMPFLMQVEKAKMRSFVPPGQSLEVEATLQHEGSGYAVVKASITAGGKKVTEAEIRYGVVAFPNAALKTAMLETARRVGLAEEYSMAHERDALITGIGIVSSLGSGLEAHWAALNDFTPVLDTETFAPFAVHPIAPMDLDKQIPKRGDQRQMEAWQRIGVYAAGLALNSARAKGNADLLSKMGMIVAAGGGERDYAVDCAIMSGYPKAADPGAYLNEHLLGDLRPTLFLAQLSNLLAGNISIVHGVIGSSRTFMGEEACGADAVRIACARIAAGQGEIMLVGGSYNAQRADTLLHMEMAHLCRRAPFDPVWARQGSGGGMILGSVGCFLVIESRAHAAARGVQAYGHIAAIRTDRCRRQPGQATANARAQLATMTDHFDPATTAVISGASGVAAPTQEEQAFLGALRLPVRASGTALGLAMEPSFPASLALAAMSIQRGVLFPPLEAAEQPMAGALKQALVTSWGHWRGEALALVTAA